ncbi:MAG: hypothetical protein IJK08_07905 [Prevotella sp.]|nr:hypothetical protein [Prevotella sp.]
MKKAFIITAIIMLIAGGAGWYYYDKEQKRQAAERAAHDSIRHARDLENARLAALDKARRDSLDEYEKTHGTAVIREALLKLLDDEVMNGRNKLSGDNWSERIKILREQCENVIAYNKDSDADSVFHAFSFKGLMGKDIRILSDSVTKVYYVSQDSAWADVHFKIQDYPEGQDVTYKMLYYDGRWILDDFIFEYADGERVIESEEMKWFIDFYGAPESEDSDIKVSADKPKENAAKPKENTSKPKESAAKPKENTSKLKESAAKPKGNTSKPKDNAAKSREKSK